MYEFIPCFHVNPPTYLLLQEEWPEGYKLAGAMNFRFQQSKGIALESIVNTISGDGMKLMRDTLLWNPEKRPSAPNVIDRPTNALYHCYFSRSNTNTFKFPRSWEHLL